MSRTPLGVSVMPLDNRRDALIGVAALAERLGLKPRDAFQPIRIAVTGSKVSPGLFESMELLGRDETLSRLEAAAD